MHHDLIDQHIAAMTTASTNLLRQMEAEGLNYRVLVRPEDTATTHVQVHNLTPEVESRIRRCLEGTGMQITVAEA